jgi:hypothetical protein
VVLQNVESSKTIVGAMNVRVCVRAIHRRDVVMGPQECSAHKTGRVLMAHGRPVPAKIGLYNSLKILHFGEKYTLSFQLPRQHFW